MQIKKEYQNITSDGKGYFVNGKKYPRVSTILANLDKHFLIHWAAKMAVKKVEEMLFDKMDIVNMQYVFNAEFKEQMLELAANEHTRIKEEGGEYGTLIHNGIETWLKGGDLKKVTKDKNDFELMNTALDSFKEFWDKGKFELIASELAVGSIKLGYGGRIDILARQYSDIVLIDVKTGKNIGKKERTQCGLYTIALEEMFCDKKFKGFSCTGIGCSPVFEDKISKAIICHIPKANPKVKAIPLAGDEFEYAKKAGLNLVDLHYNLKGVK